MSDIIQSIDTVSDGIVVEFQGGVSCYYSADFLLAHTASATNRVFLDYDPTPRVPSSEVTLRSFASLYPLRTHDRQD